MLTKTIIVGAGISGASLARLLAERGESVLVIDAKDHIAGNCYDCLEDGIMVHKYGTHIFHTNNKDVWDFLCRFTKWYPYQHKVLGLVDGQTIPIPFNLNSLHLVFPKNMADKLELRLIENFGFNKKIPILKLRESGDGDLQFLADYIYQKIFLEYTLKQWGLAPDEIDPAITGRVPVYISRDDRYFQDRYQGIPMGGFTAMVGRLLDHPNIAVQLNTPFDKGMQYKRLFHTGSIDEFFDISLENCPIAASTLISSNLRNLASRMPLSSIIPAIMIGRESANTNGFWTIRQTKRLLPLNIRPRSNVALTNDIIPSLATKMRNYTMHICGLLRM